MGGRARQNNLPHSSAADTVEVRQPFFDLVAMLDSDYDFFLHHLS
jgi:hypothetical protein